LHHWLQSRKLCHGAMTMLRSLGCTRGRSKALCNRHGRGGPLLNIGGLLDGFVLVVPHV